MTLSSQPVDPDYKNSKDFKKNMINCILNIVKYYFQLFVP